MTAPSPATDRRLTLRGDPDCPTCRGTGIAHHARAALTAPSAKPEEIDE